MQALTQISHYWGVITVGWVPLASLAAASITAISAICLWYMTDTKSKAGLLTGQIAMQLLCAGCMLLATVCWVHPSKLDPKVRTSLVGTRKKLSVGSVGGRVRGRGSA